MTKPLCHLLPPPKSVRWHLLLLASFFLFRTSFSFLLFLSSSSVFFPLPFHDQSLYYIDEFLTETNTAIKKNKIHECCNNFIF